MSGDLQTRFAISPLIDIEIDVGGAGLVGLSPNADHQLRVDVTAAVINRQMGGKSLDYTRKVYLKNVQKHCSRDGVIRGLTSQLLSSYQRFYETIPVRNDAPIGLFAFDLTFIRSYESIKLMLLTARQGFLIEPCLIGRSLIEQFAYAIYVLDKTDNKDIFGVAPQSLLKYLRLVCPSVGRAYSQLSALAHFDPHGHHDFIGKDENAGEIVQRSYRFKIASLAWVFYILETMDRVFWHCYGDNKHLTNCNASRIPTLSIFDEFFEGVSEPSVEKVRTLIADTC